MSYDDLIGETKKKILRNEQIAEEERQTICKDFVKKLPKTLDDTLKVNLKREEPSSSLRIGEPAHCNHLVNEFLVSKGFKHNKGGETGSIIGFNLDTKEYTHHNWWKVSTINIDSWKFQTINREMTLFWKPDGPHGGFSNYYIHPFIVGGLEWKSAEHCFQAQKYMSNYPEYAYKIFCARTPHMAKYLASMKIHNQYAWQEPLNAEITLAVNKGVSRRPDWDNVKDQVMFDIVLAKFQQHEDLHAALLATGEGLIAEASPYDSYWGLGNDGNGANHLGQILMKIRDIYRKG